jgi:RAQPRD family integrative conjugative element protein
LRHQHPGQIDAINRLVRATEALPVQTVSVIFFDYQRFASEVDLIRQGIKAYQTAVRAHPRQAPELTGHYLRQGKPAP